MGVNRRIDWGGIDSFCSGVVSAGQGGGEFDAFVGFA